MFVDATSGATEGFERFTDGSLSAPIVDPNDTGNFTRAFGVNNAGTIVGDYLNVADNAFHGYLLSGGSFTTFDHGGPFSTTLTGINDKGDLVGVFGSNAQPNQSFVDIGGTITDFTPSGAANSFALAINNSDQTVGVFTDSSGASHGFFRDSNGGISQIDVPGSTFTTAGGINDAGVISGSFTDASDVTHGFLLENGIFTTIDYPNPNLTFTNLNGINNGDPFVGTYGLNGDSVIHGFVATNTPEPGTMGLALFGAALCAAHLARRHLAKCRERSFRAAGR
jgi:hypothetical protein